MSPETIAQEARREDPRLVRGEGGFTDDLWQPGILHAAVVRSPIARGRLVALRAPSLPDGCCFLGPERFGLHPMPAPNPVLPPPASVAAAPLIGGTEIHYAGQPLALVLAADPVTARALADAVEIEIETLEPIVDFGPAAERLTDVRFGGPEVPGRDTPGSDGPALIRVAARLDSPRVAATSLETRAILAQWDAAQQRLLVHLPSQSPSRARQDIARTLGLAEAQVHVLTPDVGGAFGAKASVLPEELMVALAARAIEGAVLWRASRLEEFVAGMHGRASRMSGSLSADAAGRLLHLRARLDFSLGAWMPFSAMVPLRNAARILPGPYRLNSVDISGSAWRSNAAPVNIYRGAGRPEAALLIETLIDRLARRLGLDPVELRRRNLICADAMPWRTPTGERFDSGDFPALLETACARFDYASERAAQARRRAQGEWVGIGLAMYVEPCGQGFETARVRLTAEGQVTVCSPSPSQGQGHETSFAEIAWRELSPRLNCRREDIAVIMGDTARCPAGIGSLASRSIAIGGSAIALACRQLLEQLDRQPASDRPALLEAEARFDAEEAWASGCVIVRLSIDGETGLPRVERIVWADDAGHLVSPALAHGQLLGGLAQGFGQAMLESLRYAPDGQLQGASLLDYAIPRAGQLPEAIEIVSLSHPSPNNLLGAKGVGEAGCIGVPAALMNAALDALSPTGEHDLAFPLTAESLWRIIQHAPGSQAS
jgi:carbon-monoxide dehydrogenase large subunit